MNDWKNDPEQTGIENIIRSLKKPFHLDETFELRVMSAVHAEALAKIDAGHSSISDGHWWTKRYTLRFTALGGLAMAASLAVVIALAATMTNRTAGNPGSAINRQASIAVSPEAAVVTHFILVNDNANQVYLVGDFNGWSKTRTPLRRTASQNAWTVSVPLGQGKHEYAFIVTDGNGEHWVADPLSAKVEDEFGTESSIVRVGPTSS